MFVDATEPLAQKYQHFWFGFWFLLPVESLLQLKVSLWCEGRHHLPLDCFRALFNYSMKLVHNQKEKFWKKYIFFTSKKLSVLFFVLPSSFWWKRGFCCIHNDLSSGGDACSRLFSPFFKGSLQVVILAFVTTTKALIGDTGMLDKCHHYQNWQTQMPTWETEIETQFKNVWLDKTRKWEPSKVSGQPVRLEAKFIVTTEKEQVGQKNPPPKKCHKIPKHKLSA